MPAKRDLSDVLAQYMDENKMHCMEGVRGVNAFEKLARALGYDGSWSASTLHAFLEDNSGCIEAMIEWIGSRNNPDWKAALESQISDPAAEEPENDDTSEGPVTDIDGELEDGEIVLENFAGNTLTFNKAR